MPRSLEDDNVIYDGGQLHELTVRPRYKLNLQTYYPIISQYPWTGHSALQLYEAIPGDYGYEDNIYGKIGHMSVNSNNKDYDFVTNNCSDFTRKSLEHTFGKSANTWFFTTPGDARDFFIKNGAVKKKYRKGYDIHSKYLSDEEGERMVQFLMQNGGKGTGIYLDKYKKERMSLK